MIELNLGISLLNLLLLTVLLIVAIAFKGLLDRIQQEKVDLLNRLMLTYSPKNFFAYQEQQEESKRTPSRPTDAFDGDGMGGMPPSEILNHILKDSERRFNESQQEPMF